MKRAILAALLVMACAAPASADPAMRAFAGINGIWFNDPSSFPDDFEAGGNVSASLSPHISLVGATYYGFEHSYLRGSIGARVTATDVNDPNFSVGVGVQFQASSEVAIRPQEWQTDVSVGWRPSPVTMPRVIVIGQAAYGLDSEELFLTLGLRYHLDWGAAQ